MAAIQTRRKHVTWEPHLFFSFHIQLEVLIANESNKNIFYIIFSQIDTYILRSENLKQIILCYFRFA
jgi:hypothetical protein